MSSTINAGTSGLVLTGSTTTTLSLATNGTTRATIDASGNVGIGTATPVQTLEVKSNNAFGQFTIDSAGGQYSQMFFKNNGTAVGSLFTDNSNNFLEVYGYSNVGIRFYTNNSERMRLDTAGSLGLGGTAAVTTKINILGTLPSSGTNTIAFGADGTIPSSTTNLYAAFNCGATTQATSFTLSAFQHFRASQVAFGAGSTVTNQQGFFAASSLTGATNNYGFFSNIASGSNRWNFYAAGTASNFFAGTNNGFGGTDAAARLVVRGVSTTSADYSLVCQNSTPATTLFVRNDGIINTGTQAASPYNNTTGSAANMFVDNTGTLFRSTSSLRYKSDVTNATHGLADVLKLRSVTYKATNSGETVFGGLIAEEVHDAGLTEFVAYDKEGRPDALHYGNMVALAFKAIQELKAENDALKARIEALESK